MTQSVESGGAAASGARGRAGLVFAALCVVNGAFIAPIARISTEGADPFRVAVVVTLFASFAAGTVLAARGELATLFGRDARAFALLGALGTTVPTLLFFAGTARTSAVAAALCLQTEPVFSLILAWLVLGHRLTLRRALSALVLFVGIVLAAVGSPSRDWLGLAMLLATPMAWQLSHLLVLRRLTSVSPELLTGARYLWGGVWLLCAAAVHALATGAGPGDLGIGGFERLWILALQGTVLYYVGTMLWYQVIARIDLSRATAIVVPSVPLLTVVAAYLLLGEVPTRMQVVGLGFMTLGVSAFVTAPHAIEERERIPTQIAPIAADAGDEVGIDAA